MRRFSKIFCVLSSEVFLAFATSQIVNLILNGTKPIKWGIARILICICVSFLVAFFPEMSEWFAKLKLMMNSKEVADLKTYVTDVVARVPELQQKRNKVLFCIHMSNKLNGCASFWHIACTSEWIRLISCFPEYAGYVKHTLCHELYHWSTRGKFITYARNTFHTVLCTQIFHVEKCFIRCWQEEFMADRKGLEWYGDKESVLKKMELMERLYPSKNRYSDHPTWELRRKFIEQNIEPTYENVRTEFIQYKEGHNVRKRKGKD